MAAEDVNQQIEINAPYTKVTSIETPVVKTENKESLDLDIDKSAAISTTTLHVQQPTEDFLSKQNTLIEGRAYLKSKQTIIHPEEEENYLSTVTDENKGLGVIEIGKQIAWYDDSLLNSPLKICRCFPGSFCYYLYHKRPLIFEELFYISIFFGIVFWTALNEYNIVPTVIIETNQLGTLVAFFLGLYVSISVARWWRLRTDGIGNMWSGASGLATLLGPTYEVYRNNMYRNNDIDSNERKIKLKKILIHLRKIQRYCQCAVALVFSKQGQEGFDHEEFVERRLLTKDEHDTIFPSKSKCNNTENNNNNTQKKQHQPEQESIDDFPGIDDDDDDEFEEKSERKGIPGSYPEYMWSLVNREIMMLRNECPDFADQSLARSLQEQVLKGRSGAGLIGAQLGAQLPLTYAHGVTLMAKVYNFIICITSAIEFVHIWVKDLKDANAEKYEGLSNSEVIDEASIFFTWNVIVSCLALLVRTTSISMLLVLCQKLTNPFDNDIIAFPGLKYVKWVYMDFEILLGFGIKQQWNKIDRDYYKKVIAKKDKQRSAVDILATECGLLGASQDLKPTNSKSK